MEVYPRIRETMKAMAMKRLPIEGFRFRMSTKTVDEIIDDFGPMRSVNPMTDLEVVSAVLGLPVDVDETMGQSEVLLRWEIKVE